MNKDNQRNNSNHVSDEELERLRMSKEYWELERRKFKNGCRDKDVDAYNFLHDLVDGKVGGK